MRISDLVSVNNFNSIQRVIFDAHYFEVWLLNVFRSGPRSYWSTYFINYTSASFILLLRRRTSIASETSIIRNIQYFLRTCKIVLIFNTENDYEFLNYKLTKLTGSGRCSEDDLGMQSKAIHDSQITASSVAGSNYHPYYARLNLHFGDGGWAATSNTIGQWIQVALSKVTRITAIATQGSQKLKSTV